MVELKGSLNGIGLPAIVQLIGELRHSGSLQLSKGASEGLLGFDDGRLVQATYAHDTGMRALAACARDLYDGEFTFVEGAVAGDRTLDLAYTDLQHELARLAEAGTASQALQPTEQTLDEAMVCPLLGFADDRGRHYSRPTALHRCYATVTPSLVTAQEQRGLCLDERYPLCPRYRNRNARVADQFLPPRQESVPAVPAGVAARMAALGPMRMEHANGISDDAPRAAKPHEPSPRRIRSTQLIVGGTLFGGIVLLAVLVLVIPSFNSGLMPRPATPESTVAFQTISASARVTPLPTAQNRSTPVPTPPAPTAIAPAAQPNPSGRLLLDLKLAAGPPTNWRENPPYAGWSDGAYRLQARQPARFVAVGVPTNDPLSDVSVSATFRKTGGPPGGGYGLIVRDQHPEVRDGVNQHMAAYVLETGDLGEFGIWRRDGDHWFDLVPWTRSGAVRPGGSPNDLSVRARANRMLFLVNGVEVATVQDDTLLAGGVGIFVGGDYNEVAVDRFVIQVPN